MFFVIRCGKNRAKTSTHKFSDVDFHLQYKQLFYSHLSRNRIAFLLILGRKKFKAAQKNAPKRVSSSTLLGAYPKTIQPFKSESTAAHCTTGRSSSSEGFSSSPGVSSVGVSSSPPGVSGSSVSPSSLLSCGPRLLKSSREAS